MIVDNPVHIDIYSLKEVINAAIPPVEIKYKKHKSILDNLTKDLYGYTAITQMSGILPVYFCPKGLEFLNIPDLNFTYFNHDFFVRVLHPNNWPMIPAGINHFRHTPDDLFPMNFTVKKNGTKWVEMVGASCSLYDIPPYKGQFTLTILFEFDQYINDIFQKRTTDISAEDYKKFILLSTHEKTILKHLSEERSNFEIAKSLHISEHTVNSYRKRLIKKLGVRSIAGLVGYAYRFRL